MKMKAIAVLLACAVSCVAETVSYSIPVLTVRSNGNVTLEGSGRLNLCPVLYTETANALPVKVSITEDMPLGAGDSLRASVWLAVTTASMIMNRDLTGAVINFETSGYVDGPSAGGMLCLAVMSALEGRQFPDDFAMTGTIMVDGTIGAVGGVAEKIRAASRAGIKRVCIPTAMRIDNEDLTDLLALGQSLDLEMHQVSTIGEAYQILHCLPQPLGARLNSFEVCQLPAHIESVLKHRYGVLVKEMREGNDGFNLKQTMSLGEFTSGFFGAAVMDLVDGLNEQTRASRHVEFSDLGKYPLLESEFPTNAMSVANIFWGKNPSKAEYADELKVFHQDLKDVERAQDDDVGEDDDDFETDDDDDASKMSQKEDWFDDYVWSPGESQLVCLKNNFYASSEICRMQCDDITTLIDSIQDWSALDANDLNTVRSMLIDKLNSLICIELLEPGAENYERENLIFRSLLGTMPYIRTNSNVQEVENLFYRTMKAMSLQIAESGIHEDRFLARYCMSLFDISERLHANSSQDEETLMNAVFSEAQTLAVTCALLMCMDPAVSENRAFFSSIVTTARDNALSNIDECRKLDIPCVMPIICFQKAESKRDARLETEDEDFAHFSVLGNYLCGSLLSKALILCFKGQKPELNSKGYCSKRTVWENGVLTVDYLGVDGKYVLRDGFSGYSKGHNEEIGDYTLWFDINRNVARYQDISQCYVMSYDNVEHLVAKTYTDASWKSTPREDGVLFETFGYDEAGNQTDWEFWGASSNRVVCKDGMAVIKRRFNKQGQETWRRFYDAFGEPVTHVDGNAGFDVIYDKWGNQRKFTFVGKDGNPVMTCHGYAFETRKYNSQGNLTEEAWYGANGKLICVQGIAKIRFKYDETGNMTDRAYYGVDDELTRGDDNYAAAHWTYSPLGEVMECRYYGPDGLPTLHRDGAASWKAEIDVSGRVVGRKYYDLQDQEIDMSADENED